VIVLGFCESCGMPLKEKEERYCSHCTDYSGGLKSRETIRDGMVSLRMKQFGDSRKEAERWADNYMRQMPAWKLLD